MTDHSTLTGYQLRFLPLAAGGRAYAFPCDANGQVDLDQLSERARNDYLFARGMIGWTVEAPAVQPDPS
jgi:hypothetical protein